MQENESIVLVTGGSGGIGRAIVSHLAQSGYSIWNLDKVRPKDPISQETYREIDLTEALFVMERSIQKLVQETKSSGELFGLVHCAGYGGPYADLSSVRIEDWQNIFRVNLDALYLLTKAILPALKTNKIGRVVAIASSLSSVGAAQSAPYSAAKHGVIGLVRSLAEEWGSHGITFNAVSPGYVDTPMGVKEKEVQDHKKKILQKTPVGRLADPVEIARVVAFLMQRESGYINGANWAVDGGITAI